MPSRMYEMIKRIVWFVMAMVLLLAACAGEEPPATRVAAGDAVPDTCTLLSEADFQALVPTIGTLTMTAEGSDDGLYSSCSWRTADATQFISLTVWRGQGEEGVADQFLAIQRDGLGAQHLIDSFGTDTILAGTEAAWSLGWHSGDSLTVLITAVGAGFDDEGMISLGEKVDQQLN